MTPLAGHEKNGAIRQVSIAEELRGVSERLRKLADQIEAEEEARAEMEMNYPFFKRFVYDTLKERSLRELPPITAEEIQAEIAAGRTTPMETVIEELERILEGKE